MSNKCSQLEVERRQANMLIPMQIFLLGVKWHGFNGNMTARICNSVPVLLFIRHVAHTPKTPMQVHAYVRIRHNNKSVKGSLYAAAAKTVWSGLKCWKDGLAYTHYIYKYLRICVYKVW